MFLRRFNSAIVVGPSGSVIERYHKVQLAESWPDGGDHLSVFKIDGVPCSIIVCHDERYPELAQPFIRLLPLTALNDGLRGVMLDAASLGSIAPELAVLCAWSLVAFFAAIRLFRWE